jgi:2-polyprenyl-6-methoxyphenol hydroxylase-like FAD-dependent oxidoreductase
MPRTPHCIHIAGGGIGGLTTAVALQGQGVPVVVHEGAEAIAPVGAGLSLWPNAVLALESLGVGGLRGGAIPRGGAGLYRWDGEPLATDAGSAIEDRYGAPLLLLHRAELQHALLEALAPGTVRLDESLESYEQTDDAVLLRFADGTTVEGDLLIGADGLHSTVRTQMLGGEPPRNSGLVAYRGVVDLEEPGLAGEFWGAAGVFGVVPLSGRRVYWYATQREDDQRDLSEAFDGWADPIPDILRRRTEVLRHELLDRRPARRWTDGRVALLGDAAHPMLPFLGQGACQAIEDAVAVGAAVSEHGVTAHALAVYEKTRRKRAEMLVKRSRTAGRVAHARAGWKRGLRDAIVKRTPASARYRQLDAAIGAPS